MSNSSSASDDRSDEDMSDHDDDDDEDDDDDSDSDITITLKDLLEEAVLGADHEEGYIRLQDLLIQAFHVDDRYDDNDHHGPWATDDDMHFGLLIAASHGLVAACHLLYASLTWQGRQYYTNASMYIPFGYGPLHAAARHNQFGVVQFLVEELNFDVNQMDSDDNTPLIIACRGYSEDDDDDEGMTVFLLENGANPNRGGTIEDLLPGAILGPLWFAVIGNKTALVRVLLEYHADPNFNRRRAAHEEGQDRDHDDDDEPENISQLRSPRHTDIAIYNGNAEILRILLDHGAFVGLSYYRHHQTSVVKLLKDQDICRETKVAICEMLLEHANAENDDDADDDDDDSDNNDDTAKFLQASLERLVVKVDGAGVTTTDNTMTESYCEILIEAGMSPRTVMLAAIQAGNLAICQWLVDEYDIDPFQEVVGGDDDESDKDQEQQHAVASPFLAAARQTDTSILEYLLEVWDEQFASSGGGKNSNGDCPIHIVCCDPLVSLQAITVLVNRQPDALAMVDGEQGLLPFHFAANWGASLDVIFYLLQHCPDALQHHGGNTTAALPAPVQQDSKSNNGKQQDHLEADEGPVKKKAKMSNYK